MLLAKKKKKNRNIDQWNKTERPEINPHSFEKGEDYTMEKDGLFIKWCWENWIATCKRMKLEHFLTPNRKIKLKMD